MTLLEDMHGGAATHLLLMRIQGVRRIDGVYTVEADGVPVTLLARPIGGALFLVLPTSDVDGGTIRIAPRHGAPRGALPVLDDVAIEGDDSALTSAWIDAPIRSALPGCLWHAGVRVHGARFVINAGEVTIEPEDLATAHLNGAVVAGALLATRPRRLAESLAADAAGLGGSARGGDWRLDGGFALDLVIDGVPLVVDYVRSLPRERGRVARLRTRLRAETAITAADLTVRLRQLTTKVRRVAPAGYAVDHHALTVIVDGLLGGAALAAAVQLTAELAGARSDGPYR